MRVGVCWIAFFFLGTIEMVPSLSLAQVGPDPRLDFVTVGSAGNRPTNDSEVPRQLGLRLGAVDHEYQITRTEVTNRQWLGFVQAYGPLIGMSDNPDFTGGWIYRDFQGQYVIPRGAEDLAIKTTWHMAARFTNWLGNDRRTDAPAFESGAYDTLTFTQNADGSRNDQLTHTPGARFWIPTEDEWVKSAFFDLNKNGPGQEGYWLYPNRSDSPPISGLPGVGTTSAGTRDIFNVGSYTTALSPWGLLDTSGSESEWTETVFDPSFRRDRYYRGTSSNTDEFFIPFFDRTDSHDSLRITPDLTFGIRIATSIPAPSWCLVLFAISTRCLVRKRRTA